MISEGWRLVSGSSAIFCYHDNILHYAIIPSSARDETTLSYAYLDDLRSWLYSNGIVMVILLSVGAFRAVLACTAAADPGAASSPAAAAAANQDKPRFF